MTYLKIELGGILQAYGDEGSFLGHRSTAWEPTKKAIAGMISAAMGIEDFEKERLEKVENSFEMTVEKLDKPPKIYHDFQTVSPMESRITGVTYSLPSYDRKKSGSTTGKMKTIRKDYIMDQEYTIILTGAYEFLKEAYEALKNPFYTVYLGRKNCTPGKLRFKLCEE